MQVKKFNREIVRIASGINGYGLALFSLGCAIRFLLIGNSSGVYDEFYIPFLTTSLTQLDLDPWATWLESGGSVNGFPYGYTMWLAFLPFIGLAQTLGIDESVGYFSTVFLADFSILLLTLWRFPSKPNKTLLLYWLSPIILIPGYLYGLHDIIPALLLYLSLLLLRTDALGFSGFAIGLAISAKLSMVLTIPFFALYVLNRGRLRTKRLRFVAGFSGALLILLAPLVFSQSALVMTLANPQIMEILDLKIATINGAYLLLTPIAYLAVLFFAWRIPRYNLDLLEANLGLFLLLFVIIFPGSIGWFIWAFPIIVAYQISGDNKLLFFTQCYAALYCLDVFWSATMPSNHLIALPDIGHYMLKLEWGFANSAIQTIMLAVSLLLAQRVWSNEIEKDNFFQKTKRPMVLGIAGDSGVGKDTLVGAMGGVLGRNSLSHLSGDNYHFWDRDQINSNALTRLHPLSNDLANFSNDLEKLILGQDVDLIEYDHRVGRRKARTVVQGKDFIIASSLHAFLNGRIQSLVDLKIFIDMEPELKRFFKFRRDVNERGYHETDIRKELIRRETDFKKFVLPQKAVADITFGLFRSDPEEILNYKRKNYIPSIDLAVTVENFAVNGPLHRALLALSTTSVTVHYLEAERKYSILISGWVDADDIRNIAKLILPKMEDFYDTYPIWQSGNIGLMQLFTLNQIQENLNKVVMR